MKSQSSAALTLGIFAKNAIAKKKALFIEKLSETNEHRPLEMHSQKPARLPECGTRSGDLIVKVRSTAVPHVSHNADDLSRKDGITHIDRVEVEMPVGHVVSLRCLYCYGVGTETRRADSDHLTRRLTKDQLWRAPYPRRDI